ncbi:MAG: hypothetical protein J5I50_07695 [Chitinophagaceae bacterium]|nr:hypothetical protein [Chitinophagaceae bacterium]
MKQILFIVVLLGGIGTTNVNGQFLKNLKERALERSKEIVIEKTAEKIADKTSEAMDKLLNPNFDKLFAPKGEKIDMAQVPDAYYFQYKYTLRMTTNQGSIDIDYFLNSTEPYMAVKTNMAMGMVVVFDEGNKITFTSVNGIATATEMKINIEDEEEDADMFQGYTFKELPNRRFLDYDCIGREMENDDHKFIFYLATDTEADFGSMFRSKYSDVPKPQAMEKYALDNQKGLMMYMEKVDKKNKGKKKKDTSGKMECIAFEPVDMVINTRD